MEKETRTRRETRTAEIRFLEGEGKMVVEGYAIVFNQETLIGDEQRGFYETIDPKSLDEANMRDVPMKYNHADNLFILARTKNGSLVLTKDDVGLKVRAELIDTATNQDVFKMVKSGLLDKMSFAFTVKDQTWDRSGPVPKRRVTSIDRLYDVSIVDTPAYDGTSIYARSLEAMDLELKAMDLAESEREAGVLKAKIRIKTNH